MTVKAIIESVRWALDEEKGYEDYESGYMDRIIRSRIYDALRWVNLYADASLLNGGDSGGSSSSSTNVVDGMGSLNYSPTTGEITLPDNFLRLIRVRDSSWSKAVMNTISEDSEEYMMQNDANYPEAKATKERPVVALIESKPNKLQLFPAPANKNTINITYCVSPSDSSISSDGTSDTTTDISIPDKVKTAYIYYLAYLVMIAYNETTKAGNMLSTAKMNAGVQTSTKG